MFRVDTGTGVPIYRQLVEQVRRDVMLGRLSPGDQLPTLREVVDATAINPNTVAKAYAELEHEGLVVRRQGMGTFVSSAPSTEVLEAPPALRNSLARWLQRARDGGLSTQQIRVLVDVMLAEAGADDAVGGVA